MKLLVRQSALKSQTVISRTRTTQLLTSSARAKRPAQRSTKKTIATSAFAPSSAVSNQSPQRRRLSAHEWAAEPKPDRPSLWSQKERPHDCPSEQLGDVDPDNELYLEAHGRALRPYGAADLEGFAGVAAMQRDKPPVAAISARQFRRTRITDDPGWLYVLRGWASPLPSVPLGRLTAATVEPNFQTSGCTTGSPDHLSQLSRNARKSP